MTETMLTIEMANTLTDWYRKNKRDLPWRNTGNPYDVWLSEIMLQQTRVEAVLPRFIAFRRALPDIAALAACPEDELMKLWEGMGYYSRARNLQKCAVLVRDRYQDTLPADPLELKKLPGIGDYTAGAVAAIAYGLPVPAVDGNVLRVMARLFSIREDIRQPETRSRISSLIVGLYERHPDLSGSWISDFTQALMELGALVCIPNGAPLCTSCPLQPFCQANKNHETAVIPFRSKQKSRRVIPMTVLVIRAGDRFVIRRRPSDGLLAGLYEFINLDGHLAPDEVITELERQQIRVLHIRSLPSAKHIFTHREWDMTGYEIMIDPEQTIPENWQAVTEKELKSLPVPSAFDAYMNCYDLRES